MTELGNPFSRETYEEIVGALEESIRNGVEQPALQTFTFEGVERIYSLPEAAYALTRLTGLKDRQPYDFVAGKDFRFAGGRIVWFDPAAAPSPVPGQSARVRPLNPDQGSRFEVEYTYRERPAALTDFNPGSVIGTLVRAVARQMKLIYDQMDEVYRRAFIDEATGSGLDNVVALLGVTRNPALSATGHVTFYRRRATEAPMIVAADTRVADESGRVFRTTGEGAIEVEKDEFLVQSDGVLRVADLVADLVGVWPREADPVSTPTLDAEVSANDEREITLADNDLPEGQLRVRYRPKSTTVPIEAVQPGPEGNVNARTITIMPTPPRGVDGVLNEEPATGGSLPEPDEQLRERARHALERAGNATLNAIRFAVLDVDGVEGVEVIDRSVDSTLQPGEVRVRYSGGDRAAVARAIEETRAAGVLALPDEVVQISISGTFYLIPAQDGNTSAAVQFQARVVEAIRGLAIGAALSVSRLNALAYGVPGLDGVAEAQLEHDRSGSRDRNVPDPFLVEPSEVVRPNAANLRAVFVGALRVAASRRVGETNELDLQMVDASDRLIEWRGFSLDISVAFRVRQRTAPEQPPVSVGSLTPPPTMSWSATDTATLTIADTDVAGYREEDHLPAVNVVVGAAAYPGVASTDEATIDLSAGT